MKFSPLPQTTEETGDNVGNGDIRQEIPHPSQRLIIPRDSRVSFGHTSLSLEHSDLRYNTFHVSTRQVVYLCTSAKKRKEESFFPLL